MKMRLNVLGQPAQLNGNVESTGASGNTTLEGGVLVREAAFDPETVLTEDAVRRACASVFDPEIPVNILDLGLIYAIDLSQVPDVAIDMTLTAPACPVAGELVGQVADAVAALGGVRRVTMRLVWDPPWTQARMSEAARFELGLL